jgi:hypothetical protein
MLTWSLPEIKAAGVERWPPPPPPPPPENIISTVPYTTSWQGKHAGNFIHICLHCRCPYNFRKIYEGVSKTFQTESITKYTPIFGITHCCPLPSLCNGSSTYAMAGTDFLESRVGQSVTAPEFQWHPKNDALLASISFSETRRNLKGPNKEGKEGGGPQPCF